MVQELVLLFRFYCLSDFFFVPLLQQLHSLGLSEKDLSVLCGAFSTTWVLVLRIRMTRAASSQGREEPSLEKYPSWESHLQPSSLKPT